MKNWFGLCFLLLCHVSFCKPTDTCSVPDTKKSYVTSLAITMGRQSGPCVAPDPSVLVALNLGQVKDRTVEDMLIKQLKEDAVNRVLNNKTFTSGKVAQYVLALRSSCVDPSTISVPEGSVDLVQLLEAKTHEELQAFENNQSNPSTLTTWYQVGLDILSLCIMSRPYAISAGHILAKHISPTAHGSVDTAAVTSMGLLCVLSMGNVTKETHKSVNKTLSNLLTYILDQQNNGLLGNIYSTGLAAQALTAAQECYNLNSWNCSATIKKLIELIPQKTFSLPIAAAQVLPFLWGKSYVSVKHLQCPQEYAQLISVEFTVVNDLIDEHFKHSITVEVPEGSTLLQVMQKAAELNPKEFSFKTQDYSWGVYITSISKLDGSNTEKTYWQFFKDDSPLTQGVSDYKPNNNEHIIAVFSKY